MKREIYEIQSDVFQSCLWVFFGTIDECCEAMRAKDDVSEDAVREWRQCAEEKTGIHGMYLHNEKENISILWLDCIPTTIWQYGSLVHEIEHYVFYLFERIGMQHTDASDEAYAYMMAYIFRCVDNIACDIKEKEREKQTKPK